MKRIVLTFSIVMLVLGCTNLHAQLKRPGLMLGGNVQYAQPNGTFKQSYNYGLGAEAFGGVGFGKTFVVGTMGISHFKAGNRTVNNITYTPVKGGIRQFIIGRQVFVNADIGVAKVKTNELSESRFTRGIGAGVRLLGLEASINYDGWKSITTNGFSNSTTIKIGTSFVF
jgi:hypothetical protein